MLASVCGIENTVMSKQTWTACWRRGFKGASHLFGLMPLKKEGTPKTGVGVERDDHSRGCFELEGPVKMSSRQLDTGQPRALEKC